MSGTKDQNEAACGGSALIAELGDLADQFECHALSRSIDDVEAAGRAMRAAKAEIERLRTLAMACRGSVKTDMNAYERMLTAKFIHGEQGTPTYITAEAEAQRLFGILEKIDEMVPNAPVKGRD